MFKSIFILAFFLSFFCHANAQLTLDGETYEEANVRAEKLLNELVALDAKFVPASATLRRKYGADSAGTHSFCEDTRALNAILIKMEAITKEAMSIVQAGKLKGYPETETSVRKVFNIMLKKRVYDVSPFIQWKCNIAPVDPYWLIVADSIPGYKRDLLLSKYYALDTEIETLNNEIVAAQKDAAVLAPKPVENKSYLCRIYQEIGENTEEITQIITAMQQLNEQLKNQDITNRVNEIKPNLVKLRFLVTTEKYRYKCQ